MGASVTSNLPEYFQGVKFALADGNTRGTVKSAERLKRAWRRMVADSGINSGGRLEKAFEVVHYPKKGQRAYEPSAVVYSKSQPVHQAFTQDRTITVKNAKYLVIATKNAPAYQYSYRVSRSRQPLKYSYRGSTSSQPLKYSEISSIFDDIKRDVLSNVPVKSRKYLSYKNRNGAIIIKRRSDNAVIFVLVKQTRLRGRFNFKDIADRVVSEHTAEVKKNLDAALKSIEV